MQSIPSLRCCYSIVRGDGPVTWNNGLLRKVDDIKLKHPHYEDYSDLTEYMRIAAEDIALLKVWHTNLHTNIYKYHINIFCQNFAK